MTSVAIMQPTYLPWLGYFALIDQVDAFVFLDDVAFSRRSWQQRNRVKGADGEVLLTVPVRKQPRGTPINKIKISAEHGFPGNHLATIKHNYGSAPRFDEFWPEISDRLERPPEHLADLNRNLIVWIATQMQIEIEYKRSSDMSASGQKDEYLANICAELGASNYLSPIGSKTYLNRSEEFARRDIQVEYLQFSHPVYPQQHGGFISHLAAIDALFNVGGDGTRRLMRDGYAGAL